jgi:hypothetical protein
VREREPPDGAGVLAAALDERERAGERGTVTGAQGSDQRGRIASGGGHPRTL